MIINPDTKICSRDQRCTPSFPEQSDVTSTGKDGDKDSEEDDQGSASESSGSESAELEEGLSRDNRDEEGVVDKPGLAASVSEYCCDPNGGKAIICWRTNI